MSKKGLPKTVEVVIKGRAVVRYDHRRKIPKTVWDRYCAMVDAGTYRGKDFDDAFRDYIHPDDHGCADDIEDVEMSLVKARKVSR